MGEDAYAEALAHHHRLIRAGLAAHGGKEISTQGDGFFAVFSSPSACVAAAIEMQGAISAQPWPAGERLRVRMGIHCGEASETTGARSFSRPRPAPSCGTRCRSAPPYAISESTG
jgi:class 3 adenylate cyclase